MVQRITIQPGVMGGKPTVCGLSEAAILEQHPVLEREDIAASLLYTSLKIKNTVIIHAA